MKNDYPELNFDMEHLLQNKKYEDLTPEELNEISDFISSKEDYILMQNTFLSVKTSLGDEEEIIPAENTKSKLMEAFESKHGKVININKPRPFYLHPMFQVGVAAVFILGIVFFYPATKNNDSVTAMNETKSSPEKDKDANVEEEKELSESEAALETPLMEDMDEVSSADKDGSTDALKSETEEFKTAFLNDEAPKAKSIINSQEEVLEKGADNELTVDMSRSRKAEAAKDSKNDRSGEGAGYKATEDVSPSFDDNSVATGGVTFSNSTENTATSPATSWTTTNTKSVAKSEKKVDETDKKKSKEGDVRTNSIGGRYYQPAAAMDVKVGVSLSEKPELASFLFTAL